MLDALAPDHRWQKKKHRWWITWNGRTFKEMPLGGHSKRKRGGGGAEVRMGDVRALVRFLGVPIEKARQHFPAL